MSASPVLVRSAAAAERVERAVEWLAGRRPGEGVLVVGTTADSTAQVVRRAVLRAAASPAAGSGAAASFGWHRMTLGRLATQLAATAMVERGLAAASALAFEALCARVIHELAARAELGRFGAVATRPRLPRAIARTLSELRLAGVEPDALPAAAADLARVHRAVIGALAEQHLADRALVLRLAADAVRAAGRGGGAGVGDALVGLPLLLVDVPCAEVLERELVAALAARAPEVLATSPEGDPRSLASLEAALGVGAIRVPAGDGSGALARLQERLFGDDEAVLAEAAAAPAEVVSILSAPGEGRECVEIARLIHREVARGVPFDRIAVVLRAPGPYRPHVEQAFRRAEIPAFFARGTVRPDPAGRAFLALLACAAEGLSAKRFAEYLSLGEVPDADAAGAPPPPPPGAERWVPPDEESLPGAVERAAAAAAPDPEEEARAEEEPVRVPEPAVQPVIAGALRAPRRWERLLVDAAVIGGLDRWRRRLEGLARGLEIERDLRAAEDADDPQIDRIRTSLADLAALRAYALPLLESLAALPEQASWAEWLDRLGALASRALRRPDRVLGLLAQLAPMSGVGPVGLAEVRMVLARRLTELVARAQERSEGRVFVAPAESVRGLDFDVVFVPGLAERLFPQKITEDPVLRDVDRAGLPLAAQNDRVAIERLALRLAVGAARARVVLSYPRVDMDQQRPRVPSFYGLEALRAAEGRLPGFDDLARRAEERGRTRIGWPAPESAAEAIDDAEHDLAVLEQVWKLPDDRTAGMATYLLQVNPFLASALRTRARRWRKMWSGADGLLKLDPALPEAREAIAMHALAARSYSPTALEKLARCPYMFVLNAIHRLAPREVPEQIEEIDALQRGSLLHEVQFRLLSQLRDRELLPVTPAHRDLCQELLEEVLGEVAHEYRDKLAPAIDRVWDDGIAQIRADLREWLRRATLDERWVPWRFELAFGLQPQLGRDASSAAEPVALDNGLRLRGSIDLVERSADGTLRATDHKSGKQRVEQGAVIHGGQGLQPVLYALALEKLVPGARVESGRLYYCTSRGDFAEAVIPLDAEARAAAAEVAALLDRWLAEPFLPAAPDEGECRWCDFQRVCGPYEEERVRKKPNKELIPLKKLRERE